MRHFHPLISADRLRLGMGLLAGRYFFENGGSSAMAGATFQLYRFPRYSAFFTCIRVYDRFMGACCGHFSAYRGDDTYKLADLVKG